MRDEPGGGRIEPAGEALIAAEDVHKQYPGVRALAGVRLELRQGEVHALVGENGAGKSTLIRILSGVSRPDRGMLQWRGKPIKFASPSEARRHGIVAIFQELMIVPDMSVADNVVLGNEPGAGGFYSRREAERRTAAILARLGEGLGIRPHQRAGRLSTAQKQIIEIARALLRRAPVMIMDEPTAALSQQEAQILLRIIRQLRAEGTAILFVSHRLDEVRSIADRITVLRGGARVATLPASSVRSVGELISLMVGRPLSELFPPRNQKIGAVALQVAGLARRGAYADIDFQVRRGEVLGVAGLIGAGRTELMRGLFGADPIDAGAVVKDGRPLSVRRPRDAIRAGIAYLPEDRKTQGLVLSMAAAENIVMASLERCGTAGLVSWRSLQRSARSMAGKVRFRGQLHAQAAHASGGNQQKLVIGKWLLSGADVLVFDEPTRGIDIGAKSEIYRLIHQLAGEGAAVVFVPSELPELVNVCHRIVVMSGGRMHGEFHGPDYDEQRILEAAFAAHVGATAGARAGARAGAAGRAGA